MSLSHTHLVVISGFGDKGVPKLQEKLESALEPASSTHIPGAPWTQALQHPETILKKISGEIDALLEADYVSDILLVGHSYGALLALVLACRKKMEPIFRLVLIDGPLNGHEVKPALTRHQLFKVHYDHRLSLVKECEDTLTALDEAEKARIFTIGSMNDKIVPPESKWLDSLPPESNIQLPPEYTGHKLPPKIDEIANIIVRLTTV